MDQALGVLYNGVQFLLLEQEHMLDKRIYLGRKLLESSFENVKSPMTVFLLFLMARNLSIQYPGIHRNHGLVEVEDDIVESLLLRNL